MGQTLLVVVAILVFSIFALNQHQARASAEQSAMGSEIELAATDLARARLVEATALPFDEGLIGMTGFRVDPAALTPFSDFGPGVDPGEDGTAPPDDVDDRHGVTETVAVRRDNRAGREMRFTVTYAVRYVLPDEPGTLSPENAPPTLVKLVAVNVVEETEAGANRPPVSVTLTQVVTPVWNVLHG